MKRRSNEMTLLVEQIEEGYERQAWHGPNLRGSLRGVGAVLAGRRPGKGRHTIREIAVHCAYWKYAVTRRITGGGRGSFPLTGSNWFARSGGEAGWRADLALLRSTHLALLRAVRGLDPSRLSDRPPGSRVDYRTTIFGIAAHDIYHAGQIQLLKRLLRR